MNIERKNSINNDVNQICYCFNLLTNNIQKIEEKIKSVSEVYYHLNLNNSVQTNETYEYMKYQIDLLNNEKNYFIGLLKKIKGKFTHDIYEISESILMFLCSIENIKIEDQPKKKKLLSKIITIKNKKKNDIETSELLDIFNSTISNLEIVKDFVDVFQIYINNTIEKNKRENLHCNNFKINLQNKKEQILLEYNKYNFKINELVGYFINLTTQLEGQLKNQKLLEFLVDKQDDYNHNNDYINNNDNNKT